jgi:hypothetical protein
MTRQEEKQLLRSVRGLYFHKVWAPMIPIFLVVGFFALVIGSFLLFGFVGAVARLLSW